MSKLWKIGVGLLVVAGIVLIALSVLVKLFVTPERVKAALLPLAEQALHRQITLGEVKVGLFTGIELKALTVSDPGEGEPFVTADRVLLRFQLLPLLAKRVIIDEITLERPQIRLIRRTDGAYNISDLLTPKTAAPSSETAVPAEEATPLYVLVTTAKIDNGRLTFIDRQANATTELTELALDATGITRDGAVPVKLSARLQGALLKVDGTARPLQKNGTFHVDLQGLDAVAFEPYYRGKVPGKLSRLLIDLQGEFALQEQTLTAKGSLQGHDLDLLLLAMPTAPLHNARIEATYEAAVDFERDRLSFASLAVNFNGLVAQFSGEITELTTAPQGNLMLTVPNLDLSALKGALPVALLGKAADLDLAGTLRATANLSGSFDRPLQMIRDGDVALENVQASMAGMRPTIDARMALSGETARIETMTARIGEVTATIAGRIDKLLDAPVADVTVTLPRVDLAKALAKVPPEMAKGLAGLAPSGQIEARARLAGPVANPATLLKNAEVTLAGVQVTAGGQRPEFDGRLKLTGDQLVSENLSVRLGGNVAQLGVTARNLFGRPIVATADVTAQRFQIESLLGGGAAAAAVTTVPADQPAQSAAAGSTDLPLQASGTIRIGETSWKGLAIRDFLAVYVLRDNILTASSMTGKVAGGSFNNRAWVDLRRPELTYETTLSLQGVQADTLLTALAPQAAGALFGAMTVQTTLNGSGTNWDTISRTLSGDGTLTLSDGRLVSPALVNGLASVLQLPNLNEITFNEFHGKTRIVNGQAELDSSLLGRQLKLFPKGTLGLDGSLNLAIDTRLSPEMTARIDQRGKVTRYLLDADGWSQVPLQVTGTLQAPRYGLDPKGVQAQAGKILQQELRRGIDKLLTRPQPDAPPTPESPPPVPAEGGTPSADQPAPAPQPAQKPPASPTQQLLEESLKRILKR